MPMLSDLHAQLQAHIDGTPVQSPETRLDAHVKAITEAIKTIELNIEKQDGYDYTPEIQALGEAVTKALRAHGTNLTKALNKLGESLSVSVEAPVVNVAAPEVNAVFEVPEQPPVAWEVERDSDGLLKRVVMKPYESTTAPEMAYEME